MKVVSGGQTGVDRAALDEAMSFGMPTGGWCPAGRLAEDGPIESRYPLAETPSSDYAERTDWNVRDSDATLILLKDGIPRGGSRLTLQCAKARSKPVHIEYLHPEKSACADDLLDWLRCYRVEILNVAGPRESEVPGIYEETRTFLRRAFTAIQKGSAWTPLSGG